MHTVADTEKDRDRVAQKKTRTEFGKEQQKDIDRCRCRRER